MKMLSTVALLGTLFTANVFACGGVYVGKLQNAQLLQNKELHCSYNGEKSSATLALSIPRCLGAKPVVTLNVFGEELNVINLNVKLIRGIVKYTYQIKVEAVEADGFIACSADKH